MQMSVVTYFELTAHKDSVVQVGFNHDDSRIATTALDAQVGIWDGEGKLLQTLQGAGDDTEWSAWHPRGNVLITGSADTTMWMFNTDDGKNLFTKEE